MVRQAAAAAAAAKASRRQTSAKRKKADTIDLVSDEEEVAQEEEERAVNEQQESGVTLSHELGYHQFHSSEIPSFRSSLLAWYDVSRRKLPWRGDVSDFFGAEEQRQRAREKSEAQMKTQRDSKSGAADTSAAAASAAAVTIAASSSDAMVAPASGSPSPSRLPVSAYGVWVSEIMLQQTRVETVIEYYTRWMARFPTAADLARAAFDEVRTFWAGLGYYRRAKYLHEGAQALIEHHNGEMPRTVEGLLSIPGIGPYTAGAIASIAFQVPTPLVDGNVIRVLARLRGIDVDPKNRAAQPIMWQLATQIVDRERSGDFNQAMMELGATVCTPLAPQCDACPVRESCHARREVEQHKRPCEFDTQGRVSAVSPIVVDIEELPSPSATGAASKTKSKSRAKQPAVDLFDPVSSAAPCTICDARTTPPTAVTAYPSKAQKKAPLEQRVIVSVIKRRSTDDDTDLYLIVKRPTTGLLAGQWEFPSIIVERDATPTQCRAALVDFLAFQFGVSSSSVAPSLSRTRDLASIVHVFSHRKHLMEVGVVDIDLGADLAPHAENDRILNDDEDTTVAKTTGTTAAQRKRPRAQTQAQDKKKRANKKRTNGAGDSDGDSSSSDDDGDAGGAASPQLQSYRWVPLSLLQEDHKAQSASELGLSTGVRKVVHLVSSSMQSGDSEESSSTTTSKKTKTTPHANKKPRKAHAAVDTTTATNKAQTSMRSFFTTNTKNQREQK